MTPLSSPSTFVEIEVEPLREAWNKYTLGDGSRLALRPIVLKARVPSQLAPLQQGSTEEVPMEASHKVLVVVFAPAALRGAPNLHPPTVEEGRALPSAEIAVSQAIEEWNSYRVVVAGRSEAIGFKVKLVLASVRRITGVFNEEGDPFYVTDFSLVMGLDRPTA